MKRVLVIDDDASLRGLLRLLLEETGFEVAEACDGKAGVKAFRQSRPDLVLCDVFMPEQDGLLTIQELCRIAPRVKIIALSGAGFGVQVNLLPLAGQFGAIACLHKPFTTNQLLQVVELVLGTPANVV